MSSLVEAALDEVDNDIAEATRAVAQRWLAMGYTTDELGVVMRPMLAELAALRARAPEQCRKWTALPSLCRK